MPKLNKIILYILRFLTLILILTIGLAWIYYADPPYEWWKLSISRLGGYEIETSPSNIPNPISQKIFTTGLVICCVFCFVVLLLTIYGVKKQILKWPNLICFPFMWIGTGLIAVPRDHDHLSYLHYVGVAMFFVFFAGFNVWAQWYHKGKTHVLGNKRNVYEKIRDFILAWLIVACGLAYLISLVMYITQNDPSQILEMTQALSQKSLVALSLIALLSLDPDDISLNKISTTKTSKIILKGINQRF